LPSLKNLTRYFKDRPFAIVAIDLQEKSSTVKNFVRDNGLTYMNLLDEKGRAAALYGVSSTPMKFLIDAKGNMVGAAAGFREWDSPEFKALIEQMMKPAEQK
jgi:peroxiredoxin